MTISLHRDIVTWCYIHHLAAPDSSSQPCYEIRQPKPCPVMSTRASALRLSSQCAQAAVGHRVGGCVGRCEHCPMLFLTSRASDSTCLTAACVTSFRHSFIHQPPLSRHGAWSHHSILDKVRELCLTTASRPCRRGYRRTCPHHYWRSQHSADPLQWWHVSPATCPVQSIIAHCIMSNLATSVPCKRLFSTASII